MLRDESPQSIDVGSVVTPRREPFMQGIPLYRTESLQYRDIDTSMEVIGFLELDDVAYVLDACCPWGTFVSVRVLGPEAIGWTSTAYLREVEG